MCPSCPYYKQGDYRNAHYQIGNFNDGECCFDYNQCSYGGNDYRQCGNYKQAEREKAPYAPNSGGHSHGGGSGGCLTYIIVIGVIVFAALKYFGVV